MTVNDFAVDQPDLVTTIRGWDLESSVSLCAGLLLCPMMHAYTFALEILIHTICVHANGIVRPAARDVSRILESLFSFIDQGEELPRDVFVVNVMTERGNRRILTGTWETPEFWVQQALDALRLAPPDKTFGGLRSELLGLLDFSEAALGRNGLKRYVCGLVRPSATVELPDDQKVGQAVQTVRVRADRFPVSLETFATSVEKMRKTGSDWLGNSHLEHHPFLRVSRSIVIWALPTATSAAMRMLVLRRMQETGNLRQFSQALRFRQEHLFYGDLLRRAGTHIHHDKRLPPLPLELKWMRQTAFEFEGGRVAHVLFLHDDLQEAAQSGLTSLNTLALRSLVDFQLHLSRSVVRLRFGVRKEGMTVVIMGGFGRGFALPHFALPPNWYQCTLRLSDALALMWLERDWLGSAWRMKNDIGWLKQQGLHIRDEGDDIRVFGYWRAKARIVPLDVDIPADDVGVSIDRTYAGNFRAEARYGYDEHASYRPSKQAWFRVAKLAGLGHFRELRALPIYGSVTDAWERILAGVVSTRDRDWWIELRPTSKEPNFHTAYLLWDATMQWCGRILPLVEEASSALPDGNIEILIEAEVFSMPNILEIPVSDDLVAVDVNLQQRSITITLRAAFLRGLAEPTNRAEKQLAMAIMEGVSALNGSRLPAAELLAKIVPNDHARFVHMFMAQTARDELSDLPPGSPWLVTDHDLYIAALGTGAELKFAGRHTLVGKKEPQEFLHAAVDTLWHRIRYRLRKYDRAALIRTVLGNLESIATDDDVWQRTAAALTSIYMDQADVLAAALDQNAARSRTALSSRVLVEMAVCECPATGGADVGPSDYSGMGALVGALIMAAYNSDAIEYDLVEPKVDIWPNGEFEISRGFEDTVLFPYQQGRFQEHFKKSAADYENLFTERKGKTVQEVFDPEFRHAWEEESGFSVEQLLLTEEVLINKARELGDRIVTTSVVELSTLLEAAGIASSLVGRVLQSLTLLSRASWESPPPGFHLRDIKPWKFSRRLSLLRRPLLCLRDELRADAEIVYGAGLVHTAFSFTVGSAYEGLLNEQSFRTERMRRWIGSVNNINGHDFNETVRTAVESAGFHARSSVQMTEFGVDALGDVDVLAWTADEETAFVIECKYLRFARSVGEIGEQLRRFRGQPGDDLDAHLKRLGWFSRNAGALKQRVGLRDGFRMHQLLVTNTLVPMAFVKDLPIPPDTVIPVNRLPAVLGSSPIPGEIFAET
jgi:hypothetical protein